MARLVSRSPVSERPRCRAVSLTASRPDLGRLSLTSRLPLSRTRETSCEATWIDRLETNFAEFSGTPLPPLEGIP